MWKVDVKNVMEKKEEEEGSLPLTGIESLPGSTIYIIFLHSSVRVVTTTPPPPTTPQQPQNI